MINYYFNNEFDKENKYRPFTHSLEANDETLPPDNALRIAPDKKEGFIPCEQNGKWVLVEDHRGSNVYDVNTQESSIVDYLGAIKEGFTLLEPFEFCNWDGEKWVLNAAAKTAATIQQNKLTQNSLINDANEKITMLQRIVKYNRATDDEKQLLEKLELFTIDVAHIDLTDSNASFPEMPC